MAGYGVLVQTCHIKASKYTPRDDSEVFDWNGNSDTRMDFKYDMKKNSKYAT